MIGRAIAMMGMAMLVAGCRDNGAPKPVPGLRAVTLPTGGAAQTPNLGVGEQGVATLTWQEADGEDTLVRWQHRSPAGVWTKPATVIRAANLLANWADFPAMQAVGDQTFVATWLQRKAEGRGYITQWSRTVDGGETWAQAEALHLDTRGPEYGFVSMTPSPNESISVFWLDGRASGGHDGTGAMQLRGAEIAADGTISARRVIDDRVCDCCQTSAATTSSGPVVVYRDRSDSEVRDISIAGPGADQRRTVAEDDWTIAGCPVNGPAVAASAAHLVVAWYTGVTEQGSVRVAFATHDGEFAAPISVDLGRPLGRVDAEWLDADHALVSFIDKTGSPQQQAKLLARVVSRSGEVGAPMEVGAVTASNAAGFPRIAKVGDQIVWAWTVDVAGQPGVRVAEARSADLL